MSDYELEYERVMPDFTKLAATTKVKRVRRWHVDGKGYQSAYAAASALARKDLKWKVAEIIGLDVTVGKERVAEANGQMFPPCENECCHVVLKHYGYDDAEVYDYPFCITAKREWIAKRTAELKAIIEDVAK